MSPTAPNQPTAYPPQKTALLLLDFHNFIVNMVQPQETKNGVLSRVQNLAEVARKNSVPVIHCLIDGTQDPPSTSKIADRWNNTLKSSLESQPELLREPSELMGKGDLTFTRRGGVVSAMKSKEMLDSLIDRGVESVVICGISTSGAVLSTARDSSDYGFVVTVVRDGCWDPSDAAHQVVMDSVLPMAAWVTDSEYAAGILEGKALGQ